VKQWRPGRSDLGWKVIQEPVLVHFFKGEPVLDGGFDSGRRIMI